MTIVTHGPLPAEAQGLADIGKPVRLYDWHNVAPGTLGAGVHFLVRAGLWRIWERRIDPDPMKCWTEYGPVEVQGQHADKPMTETDLPNLTDAQLLDLHRYLAEFEFRYNHRIANGCDDRTRTNRALGGIVGKRLTYARPDLHA